jgi:hypothetical protein
MQTQVDYIEPPTIPVGMTCAEYRKFRHQRESKTKAWRLVPVFRVLKLKLA